MPLISKLVGKGVALGAEYREHRKEVKLSRENSEQSVQQACGSQSSSPQLSRNVSSAGPSDAPPSYTEVAPQGGDRAIASGKPASDDKKAALAQYDENDDSGSDSELSTEDDEADWELDEALDAKNSPDAPPPDYRPVDELVQDVLTTTNATSALPATFERTPLPCPVILPQRRPRKKERGFIRAYAPLLGECSAIDQPTFLSFLENFHRSSQASPVWTVIQISAAIAGIVPNPIAMAVTTAAQVAAGTAKELQSRHRTNDFLDKMNESLFKPAGLFAMIVKYKTTDEVARSENSLFARLGVRAESVDFNTGEAVAKYDRSVSDESQRSMSDRLKNIRLASGTTRGAIELPAAAPLVFPEVDKAIALEGPETFKEKAKDAKAFMADYLDRRAQLEYSRQDPNTTLSVPTDKRTMKSPRADPSHPMYNGGLISLVSGGHLGIGKHRVGARSRSPQPETYGRPGLYDSSRLYSSGGDVSYRDDRRRARGERRALRTEQRLAEGRRVGRKRERRHEQFLQEQRRVGGGASSELAAHGSSDPPAPYGGSGNSPGPVGDYGAAYAGRRRWGGGPLGMVKRVMQEDVLYLMIVNMPSEAELAEARELMAQAKGK